MDIEKRIWQKIGGKEFEISNHDDTIEVLSINVMRKRVKKFSLKPTSADFGAEIENKYLDKIKEEIDYHLADFISPYKGYNFKIDYSVNQGEEILELKCSNGQDKEGWLRADNINEAYHILKQRIDNKV